MTDSSLRCSGRLARVVHIREEGDRCVIIESRAVPLRNFGIVLGFLILIGGLLSGVWRSSGTPGPDRLGVILMLCFIGVPLLIGLLWAGLNRRVEIDLHMGTCTAQRRLLIVPFWSRTLSLQEGIIQVRPIVHLRREATRRIGALGCLLLLLGPVGVLIEGIAILSSIRTFETRVTGLVYQHAASGRCSILMPTYPGVLKPLIDAGFVESGV